MRQHAAERSRPRPIKENGIFDKENTKSAVELFQSGFADVTGAPLEIDGEVGSLTWGALFGAATVPSRTTAPSALTAAAVAFAITQIGVMENPLGSNRGTEVDRYLRAVGLNPRETASPGALPSRIFATSPLPTALANPTCTSAPPACSTIGTRPPARRRPCA